MFTEDRWPTLTRPVPWYDDTTRWEGDTLDRLTHLVMVDGRLVEMWSEPVEGTRWQHHADRMDRQLLRPAPVVLRPPYSEALAWLADVCGGDAAVCALTAAPLTQDGLDLPEIVDATARQRLESAAELLDAVAARCFDRGPDNETALALRRALLLVWGDEPEAALQARSSAHLAAGICWAVGKANGLFGAQGVVTQRDVQEALALATPISGPGPTIQRALRGLSALEGRRPPSVPDLLALGHADLLTARTRRSLIRLRDRAVSAQTVATSTVAVLP